MLISSLRLKNLLSFRDASLELTDLNVLIGPNASGKSNLLDVIALLKALPTDLRAATRVCGGPADLQWKGTEQGGRPSVQADFEFGPLPLRYKLVLRKTGVVLEESLSKIGNKQPPFFDREGLAGKLTVDSDNGTKQRDFKNKELSAYQSVLSAVKDIDQYSAITLLSDELSGARLYRGWDLSRSGPLRMPQPADLGKDFLSESGDNLFLVLNDLNEKPTKNALVRNLRNLYEAFDSFGFRTQENTILLTLHERHLDSSVPANRLSDGTLRFLCLLAVLSHPKPPELICIEEPELGLHPEAVRIVADLLIEASTRTQVIVTTHSEALIDGMSQSPEAVVVCEREPESGTQFRRLKRAELKEWLSRYTLGELWRKGEIGGTRW